MTSTDLAERDKVRITKVAGRYLVFDIQDVAHLRRAHNICAIMIGTLPQNPTQNLFLGLPIELYAEEAQLLVDKGVAYVADDAVAHWTQLSSMRDAQRRAYAQVLRTERHAAQTVLEHEREERATQQIQDGYPRKKKKVKSSASSSSDSRAPPAAAAAKDDVNSIFAADKPSPPREYLQQYSDTLGKKDVVSVTPTTSTDLVADLTAYAARIEVPSSYPFYRHLNQLGYYITPGLRFGGDYSVYPGDPFRYHAHFLATSYGWDEKIPMLDICTSGRLATGVKKGFLMGGARSARHGTGQEGEATEGGDNAKQSYRVRTFCLEWAGM